MNAIDVNSAVNTKRIPRVLVIDDDPAMQRLISEHINNHNMRAVIASDQRTMLNAMAAREPDLVILDLHLGSDDGLDLLRNLRGRSVVPVILISGHRREEIDRVIGLELGADDYLTKPFSLRELCCGGARWTCCTRCEGRSSDTTFSAGNSINGNVS
jgi:two-component system OmpR family response regulator